MTVLGAIVFAFTLLSSFNFSAVGSSLSVVPAHCDSISWTPIESQRRRQRHPKRRRNEAPAENSGNRRRESRLLALTPARRRHPNAAGFRSSLILPTASSPAEPIVFSLPSSPQRLPTLLSMTALPPPLKIKVRFCIIFLLIYFCSISRVFCSLTENLHSHSREINLLLVGVVIV